VRPSQVCTASKCAKCLQGGQSPLRKDCTTVSKQRFFQVNETGLDAILNIARVPVSLQAIHRYSNSTKAGRRAMRPCQFQVGQSTSITWIYEENNDILPRQCCLYSLLTFHSGGACCLNYCEQHIQPNDDRTMCASRSIVLGHPFRVSIVFFLRSYDTVLY